MDDLPFGKEEFDLIWSEGAIYNIGFQHGLHTWREYLRKGGYVAVSEVSWFTNKRPAEINDFWLDAYPEIDTIPNKVAQMQKAGYIPVASFILPENCWTEHFYAPQVEIQDNFLKNMQVIKLPKTLLPTNATRLNYIINTKSFTVMYFTSERKSNYY